jgi:AraC family transcriptional regulator
MSQLEPMRFVERGAPLMIAGVKEHYTSQTMDRIPKQWQRFGSHLGHVPGQVNSKTYGVCYNSGKDGFDYLTGVQVKDSAPNNDGLTQVEIPAHRYAVFTHREHISTIRNTIEAIGKEWLPNSGYQAAGNPDFFERYKSFDPETGIGEIEIWLPIK